MSKNPSLEERLTAIEAAIAELQQQAELKQQLSKLPSTDWLQQITGSFKDEPAFEEILAYGQAMRQGNESMLEADESS